MKKYKIHTPTQKDLLNFFNDLLKTILTDNDNGDENKNRNKSDNMIKKLNDYVDKIIDKSKLFEDQIKLF